MTLAMIALWIAAIVDIMGRRRSGTFTSAGLMYMAAAVSVAAVIAVAGICAVFAGQRYEAAPRKGFEANEQRGAVSGHTYLFSFGLDNVSNATSARPTSMN